MPRNPRCVVPGLAHHVTQRGVIRRNVFFSQQDRKIYLELVAENLEPAKVRVIAWCLMTNHVHWLVVPESEKSLAVLFRRVHGKYAQYLNTRKAGSGNVWQNRYFSCPIAPEREIDAIRYIEWNPPRAGIVRDPADYEWSSAAQHLCGPEHERQPLLDWDYWRNLGGADYWRELLARPDDPRESTPFRRSTYAGAPIGPEEFIADLEKRFGRNWRIPGRPKYRIENRRGMQSAPSPNEKVA